MKLDDKIKIERVAYLLKRDQITAFKLAILYYTLATRRKAEDKIVDACRNSVQWLKRAGIQLSDNFEQLDPSDQLETIEQVLVQNKTILLERQASVGARHCHYVFERPAMNLAAGSFGLAYVR